MLNKNKSNEVLLGDLDRFCKELNFQIDENSLLQLKVYLELLIKWNKVMNLVGITKWREIFKNLIMDSFYLSDYIKKLQNKSIICAEPNVFDLGAGGGIPGIPLRILWQKGNYYMIEAREKRAIFLTTVLEKITLAQTYVFMGRAEDFFTNEGKAADLIVSRAFMPWQKTLPLVENMLKPGGKIIFMVSERAPEVLINNWQIDSVKPYRIQNKERFLWVASHK